MTELTLFVALLFGILLGGMFFGGLWWTVRKGLGSGRPELWFLGSLLVRASLALAGFYAVLQCGAPLMLSCLTGFVIAKIAVTTLTRPPLPAEGGHAN